MRTITAHKEILPDAVLKAVIIYDDFDAATDAMTLLERVGTRISEAIKWDVKPWRCDVLKQPSLAALTVAVAANADLVVLALRRADFPPAELLDWLKKWAEHRRIEDAAVLTLHTNTGGQLLQSWDEIKALVESYRLIFLGSHRVSTNRRLAPAINRVQARRHAMAPVPSPSNAERLSVPEPLTVNK